MDSNPLRFPYMAFARTESFSTPCVLSQSGMPAPEPAELGEPEPIDPGFGGEVQAALEARLAERLGVEPRRVIATVGASAAMNVLAMRYFRGAGRVAVEIPSYEALRALPPLFGAELALVERRAEDGWRLDPGAVEARLEGCRGAGSAFLTNTHNPTGALSGAEEIRATAEIAARAGGILLCTEVYMEFLPAAERVQAFLEAPNAVSVGSLTKAYGMGGLRVGWIALGEGLARDREGIEDMIFLSYVDPPTTAMRGGLRALDRLDALRERYLRFARESRPHLIRWLAETEGVEGSLAEHGLIAFPRILGVGDTFELRRHLAREHGVDVMPGEFFGAPGHIRVGFGQPEECVRQGLERLTEGIRSYRDRK